MLPTINRETASDSFRQEAAGNGQRILLSPQKLQSSAERVRDCVFYFYLTLQVRDRVQGRLVSGSCTPQCLLGSNTLPVKHARPHTHTLH